MLLLNAPPAEQRRLRAVLLFGAGLIGRRVGSSLARRGWTCREMPTPWQDDGALVRHLEDAGRLVLREGSQREPVRIDVIWSAGRAGFGSDEEQTRGEEENFLRVLGLVERLAADSHAQLAFHLASSAGGLFEGQRHVEPRSRPEPRRPYGVLKLRLEEHLEALDARSRSGRRVAKYVYRLASVYGPAPDGGRRGLIGVLLHNARQGKATTLVGQLTTLRDYVFTEDVARHLADACTRPIGEDRCEILASGKPTTIHEIVQHVRRVVHRPPALVFAARRDNATDITFAPSVLPESWAPTDLETAIFQLHRNVFDERPARLRA